jgi:predicted RNA-binding protein associated with RNAse of E/G family
MTEIQIEYIRPGKGTSLFIESLVSVDALCLKTFKVLPTDVVTSLARSLVADGLLAPHQKACAIAKTYFFEEHFNLLEFYGEDGELLGYYSDIGTPLRKTETGYAMTDWFLDIWLSPGGRLVELDVDEFEQAVSAGLLTSPEVETAQMTFARLIAEVQEGIYPNAYFQRESGG